MATTKKPQDRKKPAPRAQKRSVSTASGWKQRTETFEVEVPSGNVALLRRQGLQAFVQAGVIPNSLMPLINKAMAKGELDITEEMGEMSTEKLQDIVDLYDAITLQCVVEPHVEPIPKDEAGVVVPLELREPETLYVDEVDFEDKVFIFQWVVGGTTDVEAFRAEQAATLASVHASEGVVAPAVNPPSD